MQLQFGLFLMIAIKKHKDYTFIVAAILELTRLILT